MLLSFSFCNQILITPSKYKLNKTDDSGHLCLTPWVMTLESSDIQLPALTLMFSIYVPLNSSYSRIMVKMVEMVKMASPSTLQLL
jgi:hypothetical protein